MSDWGMRAHEGEEGEQGGRTKKRAPSSGASGNSAGSFVLLARENSWQGPPRGASARTNAHCWRETKPTRTESRWKAIVFGVRERTLLSRFEARTLRSSGRLSAPDDARSALGGGAGSRSRYAGKAAKRRSSRSNEDGPRSSRSYEDCRRSSRPYDGGPRSSRSYLVARGRSSSRSYLETRGRSSSRSYNEGRGRRSSRSYDDGRRSSRSYDDDACRRSGWNDVGRRGARSKSAASRTPCRRSLPNDDLGPASRRSGRSSYRFGPCLGSHRREGRVSARTAAGSRGLRPARANGRTS